MSQKSAELIKNFLENFNVTISDFARVTGVSRASVYKYLAGEPIHKKQAKMIEEGLTKKYRFLLPYEKLID